MSLKARQMLARIADLAEEQGVVFMLENLNLPAGHPGVPFAFARDTLALASSIERPGLRLNLDLYHAVANALKEMDYCRASWSGGRRRGAGRSRPPFPISALPGRLRRPGQSASGGSRKICARCRIQADCVKTQKRAEGAQDRFAGDCFAAVICPG